MNESPADLDLMPFRVRLEQLTPRSPVSVRWEFDVTHPTVGTLLVVSSRVTFMGWN